MNYSVFVITRLQTPQTGLSTTSFQVTLGQPPV